MSLLLRHLESHGLVSPGDLEVAARRQQNAGGSLDTALLELGLLTPTQLDEALCEACGLPGAPVRLLERGPQRPWDAVPKDLVDIGWAIPLATEAGQTIVAVHPDLPDAKLGQLYRQIRGFYPVVAPECCLAKVAAERSGAILSPRYALVVLDYLQGLRRRESGRDDDDAPAEVAVLRPGRPAVPSDTNPVRPASGRQPAARPLQPEPPRPLRPESVAAPAEEAPEVASAKTPEVAATRAPEVAPVKAPEVAATRAPEVASAKAPEVASTKAPEVAPVTAPEVAPAAAAPATPAPASPPVLKDKPEPTRTSPLEPTRRRSGPTPAAPTVVLPLAQRLTAARAALAGARERDRITEALVRAAAIIAPRVGLFGVKREGLRVLAAPGSALRLTEGLVIPLPEGGLLDRAVMGQEPFTLLTEPSLSFAVGQPLGIPCVFDRVVASGRTVLMLYLDRAGVAFDPAERAATRDLCETARQSLESLLRLLGWNIPVAPAGSDAGRAPVRPPALNLPLRPVTPPPIPDTPGAGVLPVSEPGRIVVPGEPARSPFTSTIVARTPSEMVGAPAAAPESQGPAAPSPTAPPREPPAPVVERPRGPVRPIRARAVITLMNPIRRDDVGAPSPAPSPPPSPAAAGEPFGPDSPLVARFAAFSATDDPKEEAPRTVRPASEAPAESRAEAAATGAAEADPSEAGTERAATPDAGPSPAATEVDLTSAAAQAAEELFDAAGAALDALEAVDGPVLQDRDAGEASASVPVISPEAGGASSPEAAGGSPALDAGEGVADAAAGAAVEAPTGGAEAASAGEAGAAVEAPTGGAEAGEAGAVVEAPTGGADAGTNAGDEASTGGAGAAEVTRAEGPAEAAGASPAPVGPDESASTLNMPNLIAPPGATGAPRRRRKPDPVLVIPATLRRPTAMSASPHPMGRRERAGEETSPPAPSPTLSMPATLVHPRAGRRRGKNDPRPEVVALTMPRLVRPREEEPAGPPVTGAEGHVEKDMSHGAAAQPAPSAAEGAAIPQAAEAAAPAAPAPETDAPVPAPEAGAPEASGPHEPSAATTAAEPEDPIEAYLREPEEPTRLEALRQLDAGGLARLGARFPGPIDLASAAGSPAPSAHGVLLRACVAIGSLVTPTIVALLASPRPQIRFYAAFLFQELRDPRCCSALGELAFDADPDVRLIATRVLESYAREPELAGVVPKIRAELDSADRARQVLAAEAVGTLRDTAAVPRLIDLLAFREKELREAALEALCSITAKHYGYRSARWRAWHEEHGHESRIDWVIDGLRHRDAAVRRWAADELVRVTNQRIVFPVDGDKKAREIALRQWLDWWDAHRDEFAVRR